MAGIGSSWPETGLQSCFVFLIFRQSFINLEVGGATHCVFQIDCREA
jgi:hypothetical protein